jgi:hypothetical protein
MSDKNYVYVAEAYTDDGERTEQLVHTTRTDAVIDIKQTMDGNENVADVTISEKRLWLGQDEQYIATR